MFDWYKWDLIKKLENSNKAIIGLGDSFTQGTGACTEELWEKCNWNIYDIPREYLWEFETQFYENSWVNQLCKNHFIGWTPINFGMGGRGNRAAVKELYLHPELKLDKIDEKIVIFMLSGIERFDFVHKNFNEHIHFNTIWPVGGAYQKEKLLWDSYGKHVYSDRTAIIELILSIAELKTWCKLNNAELVLVSAFRPEYQRDYFIERIRDGEGENGPINYLYDKTEYIESLVDIIDWDRFVQPGGYKCVSDYLCALEGREDLIMNYTEANYYQYGKSLEKMSPNGYITNCAHPSMKAHPLIAETIYDHLLVFCDNLLKNKRIHGKKILADII